jgi:hypothetical protein
MGGACALAPSQKIIAIFPFFQPYCLTVHPTVHPCAPRFLLCRGLRSAPVPIPWISWHSHPVLAVGVTCASPKLLAPSAAPPSMPLPSSSASSLVLIGASAAPLPSPSSPRWPSPLATMTPTTDPSWPCTGCLPQDFPEVPDRAARGVATQAPGVRQAAQVRVVKSRGATVGWRPFTGLLLSVARVERPAKGAAGKAAPRGRSTALLQGGPGARAPAPRGLRMRRCTALLLRAARPARTDPSA